MDRILRGPGAIITLLVYDASGDLVDAGVGDGTADVTDSAGATVAGSPFNAINTTTGTYQVTLPSSLDVLDTYGVVWNLPDATTRTTEFEIVGSLLFAQADLRAFDSVLASESTYPDALIVATRHNTEERFEQVADVSFTLRGSRLTLDGTGITELNTGVQELRRIVSASIDGTALTAGEIAELAVYPHGTVYRQTAWPSGRRNVTLLVEHGFATVPEPVKEAGLRFAKSRLVHSALEQSERATAVFTDLGGYRLTIAGRDGSTGLPEVDAVLAQYGRRPAGSFA